MPSYNDFFDVCGDGTTSTIAGYYGTQIGRTDNVITKNIGSYEWLSGQHSGSSARVAGGNACANFGSSSVVGSSGFRAVLRPSIVFIFFLVELFDCRVNNERRESFISRLQKFFQLFKIFLVEIFSKAGAIGVLEMSIIGIDSCLRLLDKF